MNRLSKSIAMICASAVLTSPVLAQRVIGGGTGGGGGNRGGATAPPQGTMPAEIAANFPAYVLWEFRVGQSAMNTVFIGLKDNELLHYARRYIADGGDQVALATLTAQYLDARNLVRWQAAVGQALLNPYVGAYSAPATSYAYFTHPALRATVKAAPTPAPTPPDPFQYYNTPIEEMYLEFRTAPGANCNAACAMTKVAAFLAPNIQLAWNVGTAIGTTFYNAMTAIDPSYGYDLVTGLGDILGESGLTPPSGTAWVENPDGTWMDQYGNVIPPPQDTVYGVLTTGTVYDPWYYFYDPYGECVLGLDCEGN